MRILCHRRSSLASYIIYGNALEGTIKHVLQDGQEVDLLTACGVDLKARVTVQALDALDLKPGVKVYLLIKASSCHLLS